MGELDGRVALVTGSTGEGMGRSIALALAREGARIVLNYGTGRPRNLRSAQRIARVIEELGSEALIVKADTSQAREAKTLIAATITRFGRIDILVNNAGGPWAMTDLPDIDPAYWRKVLGAELDGAFLCTKYTLPSMRAQRWGRIIFLAMDRALCWNGPPYDAVLGKAGRLQLTLSLARKEIEHGITVNAIAPGYIRPVPFDEAIAAVRDGKAWQRRKWAKPHDVAELVLYLASERARFVTGSIIALANNPFS